MRRLDREVIDEREILKLLKDTKILHLGLIKEEFPHIIPLHYGFSYKEGNLNFYMHSAKVGEKLDLINKNNNVFIELENDIYDVSGGDTPCKYGALYSSFMGKGKASILNEMEEKIEGIKILMKHQTNK